MKHVLLQGELTVFLRHIKLKNHKEGRMKEDFRLGEQGPTPLGEANTEPLELVEQNVIGLGVGDGRIPRSFHDILETRQP